MTEKDKESSRTIRRLDWDLDSPGSSDVNDKVVQAIAMLRLLNDGENPFSLPQVIARANELADAYSRWEVSGALIRDIAVGLSDNLETTVGQPDVARSCGLHFIRAFDADAVLYVWKRADEQFEEVQLLSLPLSSVPAKGYSFEKKYPNGQTLILKVERAEDGQFSVSVECTEPGAKPIVRGVGAGNYKMLPLLVPVAVALAKLGSFLRLDCLRDPRWLFQPRYECAYVLVLIMLSSLGLNLAFLKARELRGTPEQSFPLPKLEAAQRVPPKLAIEVQTENIKSPTDAVAKTEIQENGKSRISGNASYQVGSLGSVTIRTVPDPVTASQDTVIPTSDENSSAGLLEAAAVVQRLQETQTNTAIYVLATAGGDAATNAALRQAFVAALENTDRFTLTDRKAIAPREAQWWIDVRYAPTREFSGVVFAELYDKNGHLLWHGDETCQHVATDVQFQTATQHLVAGMLASLGNTQFSEIALH